MTEFDGGARRTGRKPPYSLVPIELMEAVALTRQEGDLKYQVGNWMRGDREFFVDCLSHAIQHLMDAPSDPDEDMLTHLGHAATNIGFILWAMKRDKVTREDFQNIAAVLNATGTAG